MRSPVPVVVVEGTLNGLGVVRSLTHGRMPIYLLADSARCAARWSRYCRFIRIGALRDRELLEALVELGQRLACRPVLILTGDESVNCVSHYRHLIEPLYRISLPSPEVVRALADKCLFHRLAEQHGFPVPRSVTLSDMSDLALLGSLRPPLIVKPADKTLVLNGVVDRAVRAADHKEAQHAAMNMLARAPRIIVQEWVSGPDSEIYFSLFSCDRNGKPLDIFVGRKLVCSPPAIGSTAVCVAAPERAAELIPPTLQFIERVGYRGLGSLEFKRDVTNGQFFIIEPTVGRTDWQEELATLCGVNLPLLTYLSEVGHSIPPPPHEPLAPLAWRQSAGYRAPLAPGMRAVDGFFRWSDPLPGLYYYAYEGFLLRLWNKAFNASGPRAPAPTTSKV